MKNIFLILTLSTLTALLSFISASAQQTEAKSVTVMSPVFGNRFCARSSAIGTVLYEISTGDKGEIPGPVTENCVNACVPEGDRYLVAIIDDKSVTYKAKDPAKLKESCGKKVVVKGKAIPTAKEGDLVIEIESVEAYIEPVKKPLVESDKLENNFGNAAVILKIYLDSLRDREKRYTVDQVNEQQASAKSLITNTGDKNMWDLLRSYHFNIKAWFMAELGSSDEERKRMKDQLSPVINKCSEYAAKYLRERTAPPLTDCRKLP